MKISARNQLKAKVKNIAPGAINSEIVLTLPGGQEVVATITNTSVKELGLSVGSDAYAIIKASNVIVGVD
ncbi:MAG TPA: molybdopterin-binding protein [Polyangiaceae bacterium]